MYKQFDGALHRYLSYRMGSQNGVDDMKQEVYLRVIQHFNPDAMPSWTFLRTIASNLLIDRARRDRSHAQDAHVPVEDFELAAPEASPEQILETKEWIAVFQNVIETLKPNERRVFVLHRFKGHTYDEIARKMGISKSMVKKHICHVLRQFRNKVGERI